MTHLDDLIPKSPAWFRELDMQVAGSVPLGPQCKHTSQTLVRERVHCYGTACAPVREKTYVCDDCETVIGYTSKA